MFDWLELSESSFICFTGGGGKTTLMLSLARRLEKRFPVIVTTTTRMSPEEVDSDDVLSGEPVDSLFEERLQTRRHVFSFRGVSENKDRYLGFAPDIVASFRRRNPGVVFLVEADGSRRLPLKGYAEYEPPLPERFDCQMIVVGVDAFLQPMNESTVARFELVRCFLGINENDMLTLPHLVTLLNSPEMYLRNSPPDTRRVLCLNKADLAEPDFLDMWIEYLSVYLEGYCGIAVTGRNMKEKFRLLKP